MELDYVKLRDIKPALSGYIREAESILRTGGFPDEKSVHDVRVLMKKARSVLRIIAPQLNPEFTDREFKALREVGRIMSSWRETSVIRKSLKELKKKHPDIFSRLRDNERLTALNKKPEYIAESSEAEKRSLAGINEILNKSGYRIRFEPMNNLDPQLLLKELEMTFNRVTNNYLICRNKPGRCKLHELRKSSKDFLYQLWFFRPLNAPVIKTLEKKLDTIAQNLGKYNDLSLVIMELGYRYEYTANPPVLDELVVVIREEQDKYLSKVWPVAHKIFCPGLKLANLLGFKLLMI